MLSVNRTLGLIPQIIAAGQPSGNNEDPVSLPGAAGHPDVAVQIAAEEHAAGGAGSRPLVDAWSDSRSFSEQLASYPATCFLAATFVAVFVLMSKRRLLPSSAGSSYRYLVVRSEWWRVLTAAIVHSGLLHLGYNVSSLWACRRLEAELGSWGYLLASAHLVVLSEMLEKAFLHTLVVMRGRLIDEVSIGYSGVIFAWMVVLSLKPDAAAQVIGGVMVGRFTYVLLNLLVVTVLIRRSSFFGHVAGIGAGLVFSAGGLEFARERYWGVGLAAWTLTLLLGSLKATTTVPVPLVDYADFSGRSDLGVAVTSFDWSNREALEDYVIANA